MIRPVLCIVGLLENEGSTDALKAKWLHGVFQDVCILVATHISLDAAQWNHETAVPYKPPILTVCAGRL